MSDPESLIVDASDPAVTVLTLNRPDRRNALSIDLLERLRNAVESAQSEPGRRVLIIRGAGPAFCAGLDFHEAADPALAHRSSRALAACYRAICTSPLVTIAAAHGAAMGGGAGLVAACDLAVAADDLRVAYPEVHRGLVAALVTCLLRRQLHDRQIRELTLLGHPVSADRALQLGLVNRVVPRAALDESAAALAAEACRGAPGAIARTKTLLDQLDPIAPLLDHALEFHLLARNSDEAREGVAAFLEKRPPRWGGP
jgi:methylglutaconyl-CoA hydratase